MAGSLIKEAAHSYAKPLRHIIEAIFQAKYQPDERSVDFEREDIVAFASELNVNLPKNMGIIYLPNIVLTTYPAPREHFCGSRLSGCPPNKIALAWRGVAPYSRQIGGTLSLPQRCSQQPGAKDAAEWLPPLNRCWFVRTIIRIKRRYRLMVDRRERNALASVLGQCE